MQERHAEPDWPRSGGDAAARIRGFDWAATALGPIAGWSDRLRLMVELVLASPLVSSLACGPECVLIYNDAAAALYGDRHPEALGRPLAEAFPAGWETVAPYYARAFRGETVRVTGEPLDTRDKGAMDDVFDALLTPVHEADGRVAYVHMTGSEIGMRQRAEERLRAAAAEYRYLFDAIDEGFCTIEVLFDEAQRPVDYRLLSVNAAFAQQTGLVDPVGRRVSDLVPDLEAHWFETYGRIARTGRPERFEDRAEALGRWYDVFAFPVGAPERRQVAVLFMDVLARKRAEEKTRESEARLRAFVTASSDAIYRMSPDWSEMRELNGRGFLTDTRSPSGSWLGAYIDPADQPRVTAVIQEAIRTRATFELEHRVRRQDGSLGWTQSRAVPLLDEAGEIREWFGTASDVTARKAAETALRASEERQAFLLRLSDALRSLADAVAIQDAACRLIAERLQVERAYYVEVDEARGIASVARDYVSEDAPSLVGEHPVASFSWSVDILRRGECHVVADTRTSALIPEADRAALAALRIIACAGAPLIKADGLVGALCVTTSWPRAWGAEEIELLREVGERIWSAIERARAEAALRDSEERFSQFAASSADALWIRDGETLTMEYVSPAIRTIYGVPPEALLGGVEHWAALVVPEDRDLALEHLRRARTGEAVVHAFRIQRPSDGAFRWIRNTDFPLHDPHGRVQRIGGIAQDVTEARLATEHAGVLLAELQHRVRNIMAVIRAITESTAERAETVPDYAQRLVGRLMTLARVQALLTRAANVGVGVTEVVRDELSAKARHESQYRVDGPDLVLSPKAAEVLTLAVHELTTNALKFGALAAPHGRVTVRWATFERRGATWLGFDWTEDGAPRADPPVPPRRGFGSELIEERVPYELGGHGKVVIEPGGARCRLEFPLEDGDSILETDAPQRATVFGGALDMAGEFDLSGRRVLVIEDDFYLAKDAARALRGAGAEILGPYPSEEAAHDALEQQRPDAAVVDINLGRGPSFKLAATLKDRGIPFLFTTGYDLEVIPPEFESVERLQKPVQLGEIVGVVARLVGGAG
ncbi:PAS domain-containing protein [Methylobacterium sp. A54F]